MEITSETVKTVSIEELAKIRQGLPSDHPEAILIDYEIHRRQDREAIREANALAREANSLSRDANSIARSALDKARDANTIAITAAIIATLSIISTIMIAMFK